jgi:LacI family transcriptional regulator
VSSTQTIGLVVPDITNPFFPSLVQAIETELRFEGRGLLLADSLNDPKLEAQRIEELLDRQVDGLLVSPCHRVISRHALEAASERAAVVQLDRQASTHVPYVGMDHGLGMKSLLDHLRSTGRQVFALLGADVSNAPSFERRSAYVRYFRGTEDASRVLLGDFTFDWGIVGAKKVLTAWPDVDAIVCGDDLIAIGALRALGDLRIPVPNRIAVVGFDDCTFAPMNRPTLTTIRQPLEQMARHALSLLVRPQSSAQPQPSAQPQSSIQKVELPGELVVRESSAPVRRAKHLGRTA